MSRLIFVLPHACSSESYHTSGSWLRSISDDRKWKTISSLSFPSETIYYKPLQQLPQIFQYFWQQTAPFLTSLMGHWNIANKKKPMPSSIYNRVFLLSQECLIPDCSARQFEPISAATSQLDFPSQRWHWKEDYILQGSFNNLPFDSVLVLGDVFSFRCHFCGEESG